MAWEYGGRMLEDGQIESLDDWSDDKEYVYSIIDEVFDYLWWEDEKGIHFIDRVYHDYGDKNKDITFIERKLANELELHFETLKDAKNWLNKKVKERLNEKTFMGLI